MADDLSESIEAYVGGNVLPLPTLADRVRANMPVAMEAKPDYEADLQKAARVTGVPLPSARNYPNEVTARAKSNAFDYEAMAEETPAMASLFADLDKARIAHDDVPQLGAIERTLSVLKNSGSAFVQGLYTTSAGAVGLAQMAADTPFSGAYRRRFGREAPLNSFIIDYRREIEATAESWKPKTDNPYSAAFYSGIQSIPGSVGAAALGLMGNPFAGTALLGATTAGQSYAQARDQGIDPTTARVFGASQGLIEYATEMLPMSKLVGDIAAGTPFVKTLAKNLALEMPGEQVATILQDMNEWAILNPEKPFTEYLKERPSAAVQTAIATTVGTTGQVTLAKGVNKAIEAIDRRREKANATADLEKLGEVEQTAAQSKLRVRDPDAFREFLSKQTDGTPVEKLFIPAEKVVEYYQSQGMDWQSSSDFDFQTDFDDQMQQALVTGGDIVVDTAGALTDLSGTDIWEALKPNARLSVDGMSIAEAQDFEAGRADELAKMDAEMSAQMEADRKAMEPRQRVFEDVRDQLMRSGMTPDVAATNAELLASRYATRAERLGTDIESEYAKSGLQVRQVLPEGLAPIVAADQLDMAIAAMKKGKDQRSDSQKFGPSLAEFIAKRGGIEDRGGDLASRGANEWHKGKPGRRKLIRPHDDTGTFAGMKADNANTPDALAMAAWEAGYFPNQPERPTVNDLLDALDQELSGRPVYAADNTTQNDELLSAASELERLLEQRGLDPAKATPKQIRDVVSEYQQEAEGRGFDQVDPNSDAFKAWFGDSKVVDADGKPLVVYHGTNQPIEAFSGERLGAATRSESSKIGFFFTNSPRVAELYAENAGNTTVANIDEFERRQAELQKEVGRLEKKAARTGKPEDWDAYEAKMLEWETLEIDATREESITGNNILPVYVSIQNPKVIDFEGEGIQKVGPGGFSALIQQAKNEGHDGLILRNLDDTPNISLSSDHFVAFSPTQIKSTFNRGTFDPNDPRILYQSFADGPRGRIVFPAGGFGSGPSVIELFEARNLSTFIHESGHLFLEELRQDASDPTAPQQLRDDWAAIEKWFASEGVPIVDGVIPTEAHELWARGWERYAMEGKSPSSTLRKAFDAFKSWLLNIYQVVNNLKAPITPEIREVMDRLIATDEEIADARERQGLKALFSTAQEAGMSDAAFAEYQKAASESLDEAHDALLYRVMAEIRKRRTKEWKEQEASVRADVTAQVHARPEFKALHLLRTGKILGDPESPVQKVKLNRQWLVDTYGQDALGLLPKGAIYADTGTTDADLIAEMTGFRTGDEMVRTLMAVEARKQEMVGDKRSVMNALIDEETAQVMRDRYGDPLSDGSIETEALAAVHNEKQGEVIAAEIRALAQRAGRKPTPYQIAREWAKERVAASRVVDSTSRSAIQRYARAAAKAGKEAEAAMLKGDAEETLRQKQRQMLNNALVAEASKAADEVDAAVARLGKLAKRPTIKSIDQDHLDQVHQLLERYEFRQVSQTALNERESFEVWAAAQQAAGYDVISPDRLAAGKINWSRMTVEELKGLDEAVKEIVHLGRLKQKLLDANDLREFNEVVDEGVASAGMLPPKPPSDLMEPSYWDSIKSRVADMDASLLKMETVFDWLDNKDPNGVFNRVVFRRIADAQDREKAMIQDYITRLTDHLKAIPKKQLARWSEKVTAPELINRETGNPWVFTREQLISIALNMGNEGNIQRLTDGYGWSEAGVMSALNRELTTEDWAYVQNVWDTIGTLWPEIAGMEKRLNGVEPEKVEAKPFETAHGSMKGGYFPAIYDPRKSLEAEAQAAKGSDLFENIYTRANTRAGATQNRADKVSRPIHLSLGVINRHITEVIHDITHREAIMDADRFLSDRRVMKAVDETLGPEVRKQFRPWLQHIANEYALDRRGVAGWDAFAKKLRSNTSIVGMGFRLSTIILQVAGYSNSFERVGAKWVAPQLWKAFDPRAWTFVLERSNEVRNRMDTMERDIRENVKAVLGKHDLLSEARRFAFYGIGYMDRAVTIPTWLGAYNRGISEGMSDADAVYFADKAVRQSQGAGAAKDLAAVQRSNEWMRLATMFYSYQAAVYQRFRTLGRDVRRTQDLPDLIARSFWLVVVPPLLSELLAGRGPDEDEDWGMWAFQNMLVGLLGPIPIVRDVAGAMESGFGYSFTPAARAFETGMNVVKDIKKIAAGEETKRATRNALEVSGYALGLPTGQLASAVQFIVDVSEGEQDPQTLGDWYTGLSKGKLPEE